MAQSVAEKLAAGETVIGTMLRLLAHPSVADLASHAGMDVLFIDCEHGAFSVETLSTLAPACRARGVSTVVRVPELSRGWVSRVLDCGADGVLVPMLETPAQARDLVSWAKYPPLGGRGLSSFGGCTDSAMIGTASEFMAGENRRTLAVAQIETAAGVEAVDEIASVDGIDALLIGPNDLAVSLGRPDDPNCEASDRAIARVADAAAAHGKAFGMHGNGEILSRWVPRGLRLVVHGLDGLMLHRGFQADAAAMREILAKHGRREAGTS